MNTSSRKKTFIIVFLAVAALAVAYFVYSALSNTISNQDPLKVVVISKGASFQEVVDGFTTGLQGYAQTEGRPVLIVEQKVSGDTQADYDAAVTEAISTGASAIFAVALEPMRAAHKVTKDNQIPVVYAFGGDPVETGFVNSLRSSDNNLTGVTWLAWPLSGKRLEILHEMVPDMKRITTITRANSKSADISFRSITETAKKLDLDINQKVVSTVSDVEIALKEVNADNSDAIYYVPDPFILRNADILIAASIEKKLPIIFHESNFADNGALASYGAKFSSAGSQASRLMSKILFDDLVPANIPSESATDFEFIINKKTADQLGITISQEILSRADKVIR